MYLFAKKLAILAMLGVFGYSIKAQHQVEIPLGYSPGKSIDKIKNQLIGIGVLAFPVCFM